MTEKEWNKSNDVGAMIYHLEAEGIWHHRANERLVRLFAVGTACLVNNHNWSEEWRKVVMTAENYADRLITPFGPPNKSSLLKAKKSIDSVYGWLWASLQPNIVWAMATTLEAERGFQSAFRNGEVSQLLRDLFYPFNLIFDTDAPECRHHPEVRKLATAIYVEKDFGSMPVLADCLEEFGCTDSDMLDHARNYSSHAKGCWVLDRILELPKHAEDPRRGPRG